MEFFFFFQRWSPTSNFRNLLLFSGKTKHRIEFFKRELDHKAVGGACPGLRLCFSPVVWSSRSYTSNKEEPRTPHSAKKGEWVRRDFPSNDTSHYNYEDATQGPQPSTVIRWTQGSARAGIPRLALEETESRSRTSHTVLALRSQ